MRSRRGATLPIPASQRLCVRISCGRDGARPSPPASQLARREFRLNFRFCLKNPIHSDRMSRCRNDETQHHRADSDRGSRSPRRKPHLAKGSAISMTPFFSIVIACCDVEPYVRACLDSVVNQPFTDWECLIGVETSKDKTGTQTY